MAGSTEQGQTAHPLICFPRPWNSQQQLMMSVQDGPRELTSCCATAHSFKGTQTTSLLLREMVDDSGPFLVLGINSETTFSNRGGKAKSTLTGLFVRFAAPSWVESQKAHFTTVVLVESLFHKCINSIQRG